MATSAVIVAARRTPIGAFMGALASMPASQMGSIVIRDLIEKTGVSAEAVDEVIMGHVLQAGAGQNSARQAALGAGLPITCPAFAMNMVCGSGLKAVHLAAQAIKCGDADVMIAGGHESMSMAPHLLPKSRTGQRMGDWKMEDSMIKDGLWCAFNDYHMGITAENLADLHDISKEDQDYFAAKSQQKTEAAQLAGKFDNEICPVSIAQRRGDPIIFDRDEFPRAGVTAEKLMKARAAFKKDGSVSAANSSGLNDGAAAVMVTSEAYAMANGLKPLARIVSYASAGVDPSIMGCGPIPATKLCLDKAGWTVDDLDLIEANEAFAVQSLTVMRGLGLDPDKVNVNGGAISLGHPIGASGARVLVSLLHELQRGEAERGLVTLCIGGGQGVAMAVERM